MSSAKILIQQALRRFLRRLNPDFYEVKAE